MRFRQNRYSKKSILKTLHTSFITFNRKRKALLRDTIPMPYPTVMNALNLCTH